MMLNCVLGSFMSMFWSFFMLAGFTVIFAIVLVQQLTTFLLGHPVGKPASFYDDINTNFGSVESAIFTLFCGISGGDWTVYFAAVSETLVQQRNLPLLRYFRMAVGDKHNHKHFH